VQDRGAQRREGSVVHRPGQRHISQRWVRNLNRSSVAVTPLSRGPRGSGAEAQADLGHADVVKLLIRKLVATVAAGAFRLAIEQNPAALRRLAMLPSSPASTGRRSSW
jgi:hypothetical protein